MLLRSKFHDYYDSCLGFGIDKKVVYTRETTTIERPEGTRKPNPLWTRMEELLPMQGLLRTYYHEGWRYGGQDTTAIHQRYVGFCGKIYTAILLYTVKPREFFSTFGEYETHYLYTPEMLLDFHTKHPDHPAANRLVKELPQVIEYLRVKEMLEPFMLLDVPVFLKGQNAVLLNPPLKERNFGKVVGGVEAFQEISMFLSGVLGAKDASPYMVGSDEDKARAKGFDKQSFRARSKK